MKTYAQTQGEKPFDWNEFLNRENITDQEWIEASILASSWVTCACGNQCDVIPREYGEPLDLKLRKLGQMFMNSIDDEDRAIAKEILIMIEKRSQELINEINSKK